MKIYRVTDIANPIKYRNLIMQIAAYEGSEIHFFLAEKYKKEFPRRNIEKNICCFLGKGSKINGIITGTPDMWWIEKNTLFVEDWKTVSENVTSFLKDWWWDQVSIYALLIALNIQNKITKIKFSLKVFIRQETEEETAKEHKLYTLSLTPKELLKKILPWLLKKIKFQGKLIPFEGGEIKNEWR